MAYSSQELFVLRNHIPVDSLIKELQISSKVIECCFRFCCPVCGEFNTGVNPQTNLARCFTCKENYNTIDLVMLAKGLDFIHSVKLLKRLYSHKDQSTLPYCHPNQRSASAPVSIGEVLKSIGTEEHDDSKSTSKVRKIRGIIPADDIDKRLQLLEQKVEYLSHKIKQIEKS